MDGLRHFCLGTAIGGGRMLKVSGTLSAAEDPFVLN